MDERTEKAQHATEKEVWSEPKAEWIKPQLICLDEHKAAGKGNTTPVEGSYGPS